MKKATILFSLVLCLAAAPAAFAQGKGGGKPDGGGGKCTEFSATWTLGDSSANAVAGGNMGSVYSDGVDNIRAVFLCIGNPVLDTRDSNPVRGVVLDFSDAVDGASPFAGDSVETTAFFSTSQATDTESGELIEDRLLGMAEGQIAETFFAVNFSDGGVSYRVRFNPNAYDGTTKIDVERTGANSWTISAGEEDVAALVSLAKVRGKTKETVLGHFHMAFSLTVTN